MKQKVLVILALVLLAALSHGENKEIKVYINEDLKIQFSYPAAWILEQEAAEMDYVTLYSPEAITTREESLELIAGIKTEVYLNLKLEEVNDQLKDLKPCSEIQLKEGAVKQYCEQTWECYYTYTPIPTESGYTMFIGYIPEKNKVPVYLPAYKEIVLSFQEIKKGSP